MNKTASNLKIYPQNRPGPNCFRVKNFSVRISNTLILKKLNLSIERNMIHCIMGPSGAGKSTLIRCFNRISDETDQLSTDGKIFYKGQNIFGRSQDFSQIDPGKCADGRSVS